MIRLMKVPYAINSPHGSVQACLRKKREVTRLRADGGITGIGPASCCCFVEYLRPDGSADNVFGNSRIRVPFFKSSRGEVSTACVHGELSALWHVLGDIADIGDVLSIYIEMSPCPKCRAALDNILGDKDVLYSFDYETEIPRWEAAARQLCA